jgi:glutaredoxin 3
MLEAISSFFETYGWYTLGASIAFAYVFFKYLKPALVHYQRERYLTQLKKFDKNVSEKYGDKMLEARERQYQQYLAEAAREQERAAEKKRQREEKDKEESFSDNGGNSSLNSSKSFDGLAAENTEEYVLRKITSKKVVIFSKRTCPFCLKAKQAMSTFRLSSDDYEVIELDDYPGKVGNTIQNVLQQFTGAHSVPRVFINEKCIGGGDDTVAALRDGRLESWLREANAI